MKVDIERALLLIIVTPACNSQTWYPELLRLSVRSPILLLMTETILESKRDHSLRIREQKSAFSCLGNFREKLLKKEVSVKASNLIVASRRQGANVNYSASRNKWVSCCVQQ